MKDQDRTRISYSFDNSNSWFGRFFGNFSFKWGDSENLPTNLFDDFCCCYANTEIDEKVGLNSLYNPKHIFGEIYFIHSL